jgi:hypothetical protein
MSTDGTEKILAAGLADAARTDEEHAHEDFQGNDLPNQEQRRLNQSTRHRVSLEPEDNQADTTRKDRSPVPDGVRKT